jgi:flavin-dependent dehydrogenase
MASKFDAVVVGGRCAGAATALLLARAGARVLVVDKSVYGSDTLSTHALMRGGVLQLHRWGVLPAVVAAGTPPVHETTFSYIDQDVTVSIEPRYGVDALYAPRRALLDRILVDAAAASGAEFLHGVRVDNLRRNGSERVTGIVAGARGVIEADIVIGADGLHSTVARLVGAASLVEGHHAAGVLYSYWENLPVTSFKWCFREDVGVGTIPTNGRACCVFASVPSSRFRDEVHGDPSTAYRRLIRDAMPQMDDMLASGRQVEQVRGFGGHRGFIRRPSGPGWALVGDASYFKDPITAHGITDALRDAELLARTIMRGTDKAFAEHETSLLHLSKRLFEVTDEIASFKHSNAELQLLHREFSTEMSKEVRALAALDAQGQTA